MSCTPNGEWRFSMNTCFSHWPPAAFALRSRLIRLPPLSPLPERFLTMPATSCFGVVTASLPGPLDSTTSTSPFGSMYSWRGCMRSPAIFSILRPAATFGVCPCFQPAFAGTCIGGTRKFCARGSGGSAPDCCAGSSDAFPLHPKRLAMQASASAPWRRDSVTELTSDGCRLHGNKDAADRQKRDGADG